MIKGLMKLTSAQYKNQLYKQGILGFKSFLFEYSYLQRLTFYICILPWKHTSSEGNHGFDYLLADDSL
ncbi:hypothetical protein YC2023_059550 [Brassica napus]